MIEFIIAFIVILYVLGEVSLSPFFASSTVIACYMNSSSWGGSGMKLDRVYSLTISVLWSTRRSISFCLIRELPVPPGVETNHPQMSQSVNGQQPTHVWETFLAEVRCTASDPRVSFAFAGCKTESRRKPFHLFVISFFIWGHESPAPISCKVIRILYVVSDLEKWFVTVSYLNGQRCKIIRAEWDPRDYCCDLEMSWFVVWRTKEMEFVWYSKQKGNERS